MSVTVTDDILRSAGMSDDDLRQEIAVLLFQQERMTLSQAARFAGMDRLRFQRLIADRGISVHYDVADFEQDLETLRESGSSGLMLRDRLEAIARRHPPDRQARGRQPRKHLRLMLVLVDSNVLIRAANVDDPDYSIAVESVAQLERQGHRPALVPQCCYEYYVVATRPAERNGLGLEPSAAIQDIADYLEVFRILRDERSVFETYRLDGVDGMRLGIN